jgi:hypothetical protein
MKRKQKQTQIEARRRKRADELQKLKTCLDEIRSFDSGPISRAASLCMTYGGEQDLWQYKIENLIFHIETPQNTLPASTPKNLQLDLSCTASGPCIEQKEPVDPLFSLDLNIVIECETKENKLIASWHLDKHNFEGVSKEIHPEYHFHYGGHKMKDDSLSFGSALILGPPRLAHPPLDGILAVDFVVSNFASEFWKKLRTNTIYNSLIKLRQNELWRPYFKSIALHWEEEFSDGWCKCHKMFPHLV